MADVASSARLGWLARLLRGTVRLTLLVIVPVAAIAVGLSLYARGGRHVETDNAYVKAHVITVSADVPGRVVEVAVRDNQPIEAGALLFRIDPTPFAIEVERAEAQMSVVRTEVESLRAEHRVALAEALEAEARIRFLERQVERHERLRERGMSREDQYDEARLNLEAARQRLDAVRQRAERVIASLGGDPSLPVEKHPRYAQALAARDAARIDLRRTAVHAASGGVVSNMRLQAGEYVNRGVPVFSLIESGPIWVEANYKETQLTHVREGQIATIVADAFPDHRWQARVKSIAPATGAEFALLPPQNATGNWVKIVQRVPVHLEIRLQRGDPPLRAGMTVLVNIDTERERGYPAIVQRVLDSNALPGFLRGWLDLPPRRAAREEGRGNQPSVRSVPSATPANRSISEATTV